MVSRVRLRNTLFFHLQVYTHLITKKMSGQRRQIEEGLKGLPPKYSVDEINIMYNDLIADMVTMKRQNKSQHYMERSLYNKHKKLSYGLPGMFFKIVRGELNQTIFRKSMDIKDAVDKGLITQNDAKRAIIDTAKHQIENSPGRVKKEAAPGSTVQEVTFQCKLEEDEV